MHIGRGLCLGAGGSAWLPTRLGASLLAWWSPSSVALVSTKVSQANDLSGNGKHLVQGTDANRFIVSTFPTSGQPAFHPNGATCWMTAAGLSLTQPFTIYSVAKLTSQASIRTLVSGSTGQNIYFYSNSGTTMALNGGGQFGATIDATSPHVYGLIFNGGSSVIRADGAQAATGAGGSAAPTSLSLGYDAVVGQWPWDGPIGDTIVVSGAASAAQIARIEAWYRSKYGTW